MSAIVYAMESIVNLLHQDKRVLCSAKQSERAVTYASYIVFCLCALVVCMQFTDHDFSLVLTTSAGVQCLGFFLLSLKVKRNRSVEGLSSKTLEMYVLFLVTRLTSTLFKNGYLPVDRSGDWVYQVSDIGSLLIVLHLLYAMHTAHKHTYDRDHDTMPVFNCIPACVLLAVCVHGDLNDSPFFDVMWFISMYLDTIALLPQLWLLSVVGGEVESLTAHFVACMVVSRLCSCLFWFYGYEEIGQGDGWNAAGYLILVSHLLQLLLSADFMYYYVLSIYRQRRLALPSLEI